MENFLYGKIVYLDEQAVFDFLELHQNGIQSDIIKHVSENMVEVDAEGKVGMSLLTRLKIGFSGNASYQRSGVVESQITSTLLSNLKKLVTNKKSSSKVEYLDNIKLFIVPFYVENGRENGVTILLFNREIIANCVFCGNRSATFYNTTLEKHRFHESGFPRARTSQQGNVLDFISLISFHNI